VGAFFENIGVSGCFHAENVIACFFP
jgi:hypothetical protein